MHLFEPPPADEEVVSRRNRIAVRVHDLISAYGFDDVEAAVGAWKIAHAGPIPSAPARHEDPRTSQAQGRKLHDARRFSAASNSGRLLREFFVSGEKGLTDHKATAIVVGADAEVTKFEGCRRRCSDLRAVGYIEDTGREDEQRIVWAITPAGALAFSKMRRDGWTRGPAVRDEEDLLGDTPDVEGLQ